MQKHTQNSRENPKPDAAQSAKSKKTAPCKAQTKTRPCFARRAGLVLLVLALAAAVFSLAMLWLSIATVRGNIGEGRYTENEAHALTRALPFGATGGVLILGGTAEAAGCLFGKKWKPSLIGTALTCAGAAANMRFAQTLRELFAYSELLDRGLTAWDMILRHYSVWLVPALLLSSALFARAAQKRENPER